jgi:type II restriction/modification system DNA methylase subunit YeeA
VRRFHGKLTQIKVLDPACGSGNFLYVTLQKLKDLEKEVILFAQDRDLGRLVPMVGPWQLFGIEINPYAYDLAQMVVWIGYLQWVKANGLGEPTEPILKPLGRARGPESAEGPMEGLVPRARPEGNFRNADAILDLGDPDNPKEPEWPRVDYIVGNPPFLGTKKLRAGLGDAYVEKLFQLYADRIPNFSDLCCYWFEKARGHIQKGMCERAGLLATQGIRGGLNRTVLDRILERGAVFFAQSDRAWVLDGANVHVSMVGFDAGREERKELDGVPVGAINANLTCGADVTRAARLPHNASTGFIADVKAGSFDLQDHEGRLLLCTPNPTARPNSDVVVPWVNGIDVLRRPRLWWTIDFGSDMAAQKAAVYERPFGLVEQRVKPERLNVKRKRYREFWWLHAEPCAEMRTRMRAIKRFIGTPTVSKHRVFVWLSSPTLPDHQLCVFAREDDYFFGVLHSRLHEVWARAQGTQLRERESGFRYTPTTCFETFPFPWGPGEESQDHPLVKAIAEAARELNDLRERWLNPPEWTKTEVLEFPGSIVGPWARYVHDPDSRGIGTVRYPRTVDNGVMPSKLKKRTLTNLYNEMPAWLRNAHRRLDEAVCAAYAAATDDPGWTEHMPDEAVLERLLALNLERQG